MIRQLSDRDRRTLVIGAATIAGLVLFARGLPAWRRWDADTRASAGEMATEAARAESTVRQLPMALDSLQVRRGRYVALGRGVLDGQSTAAAGASLASLVSGAAARAGVQIGSVQVRPDSTGAGTFLRIIVRAEGTGDLPAITRMLEMLEGGRTLLAVRELSITQPNPGGPAEQPEALRVELAVEGLALTARAAPRDSAAGPEDAAADPGDADPAPDGVPREGTTVDDATADAGTGADPLAPAPAGEGAP